MGTRVSVFHFTIISHQRWTAADNRSTLDLTCIQRKPGQMRLSQVIRSRWCHKNVLGWTQVQPLDAACLAHGFLFSAEESLWSENRAKLKWEISSAGWTNPERLRIHFKKARNAGKQHRRSITERPWAQLGTGETRVDGNKTHEKNDIKNICLWQMFGGVSTAKSVLRICHSN